MHTLNIFLKILCFLLYTNIFLENTYLITLVKECKKKTKNKNNKKNPAESRVRQNSRSFECPECYT